MALIKRSKITDIELIHYDEGKEFFHYVYNTRINDILFSLFDENLMKKYHIWDCHKSDKNDGKWVADLIYSKFHYNQEHDNKKNVFAEINESDVYDCFRSHIAKKLDIPEDKLTVEYIIRDRDVFRVKCKQND